MSSGTAQMMPVSRQTPPCQGHSIAAVTSSSPTLNTGRVVESDFRPHPLVRGAHLQTLVTLLRPTPLLQLRRERLELPDGDFIDLAWSGEHNTAGPIAVLVHGLAGGFTSKYLRGTALQLIARGWRTVMLQLRGAGPEPNRLYRCYHQGDTDDLRYLWHLLRAREPVTFIASVGWSLGGNVTLKALAEEVDAPINIAAVASVPFHIKPCAQRLSAGLSRIYQKRLLDGVKEGLIRKHRLVPVLPHIDLATALAAENFIEFDRAYTAPLAGFATVEDYYDQCSCGQFLKFIQRALLIVHALDDPFMTEDIIPEADDLSPLVTLELARTGGHVGFIGADTLGKPYCWLEHRLADYLHGAATYPMS